jgi:hypothetical protein
MPSPKKSAKFQPTNQPASAGHAIDPVATSADEAALISVLEVLAREYGEDTSQQAVMEWLESANGEPFPLDQLAQQAKTVWEHTRMQTRRAKKRLVPIADDIDQIAAGDHRTVVIVDTRHPAAILMERDEQRSQDNIVYLERTERRKESHVKAQAKYRERSKASRAG